jgi:cytochrome P450
MELISLIFVFAVVFILSLIAWFIYRIYHKSYVKGIPIVKEQHPLWGLGHLLLPIDGSTNTHVKLHNLLNGYGPICQYYVLWHHTIHVADGKVAKNILENAKEKGVIHRLDRDPHVKNIISTTTFSENWKQRRMKFRHAFVKSSLLAYQTIMNEQICKLLDKLSLAIEQFESKVKIDKIFSMFTFDLIFRIAFETNENYFENETSFDWIHYHVQQFFRMAFLTGIPFIEFIVRLPFLNSYLPDTFQQYYYSISIIKQFQKRIRERLEEKARNNSFSNPSCFGKLLMDFVTECRSSKSITVTDEDIESEIFIFLLAGMKSSSLFIRFYFILLNTNCRT